MLKIYFLSICDPPVLDSNPGSLSREPETLCPGNLYLGTLLSSEQCLQFERFRLRQVDIVSNTPSFKTKLIGNNAEASRFDCDIPFDV